MARRMRHVDPEPSHPLTPWSLWEEVGWPAFAFFCAGFAVGGAGFAVSNLIWPNFYFYVAATGKDVLLAATGLSLFVYVIGVFYAFINVCKRRRGNAATQ